jgi:hypothetical protein
VAWLDGEVGENDDVAAKQARRAAEGRLRARERHPSLREVAHREGEVRLILGKTMKGLAAEKRCEKSSPLSAPFLCFHFLPSGLAREAFAGGRAWSDHPLWTPHVL